MEEVVPLGDVEPWFPPTLLAELRKVDGFVSVGPHPVCDAAGNVIGMRGDVADVLVVRAMPRGQARTLLPVSRLAMTRAPAAELAYQVRERARRSFENLQTQLACRIPPDVT